MPYRSSCPEVFRKKGIRKSFAKFTGKHMWQRLFFNKVAGLRLKQKTKQNHEAEFLLFENYSLS